MIGRLCVSDISLWNYAVKVFCKILQISKVNNFSKLLTFINGGGNAAHKILRIFAFEKTDYDIK